MSTDKTPHGHNVSKIVDGVWSIGPLPGTEVVVASLPNCDFCGVVNPTPAEYDGKTTTGPWANMCKQHFATYGIGVGTGRGQRLVLKA